MADIGKLFGIDIADVSKVFGIALDGIGSLMGLGIPAGSPATPTTTGTMIYRDFFSDKVYAQTFDSDNTGGWLWASLEDTLAEFYSDDVYEETFGFEDGDFLTPQE